MKKRKTRHDNARTRQIIRMYSVELATLRAIGEAFGISHHAVRTILENNGVAIRRQGATRSLSVEQVAYACSHYQIGQSTSVIACALCVLPAVILRALRASGVPIRSRGEEARRRGFGRIG